MKRLPLSLALLLASCAAVAEPPVGSPSPERYATSHVFLGGMDLNDSTISLDPPLDDIDDADFDTLWTVGLAIQKPMIGERLQLGFEGGMSVSWDYDSEFVEVDDTLVLVGDTDLFLGDLFAGVHVAYDLTERTRLYAGAGPLLQYASVDLEYDDGNDDFDIGHLDDSGIGVGGYGRLGIEWASDSNYSVGFFVRYVDASVDLDDDFDEVDIQGTQFVFAVTRRL